MTAVNRNVYGGYARAYSAQRSAGEYGVSLATRGAGTLGYGSASFFGDGYVGPAARTAGDPASAQTAGSSGLENWFGAVMQFFSRLFGGSGGQSPKIGSVNEFAGSGSGSAVQTGSDPSGRVPTSGSDPGSSGSPTIGVDPSGPDTPARETGKAWDVFFDSREGTHTRQRSPIVLDLNGNGRPDITGSNIKGDGKIEGGVKGFDLNPEKQQWATRSKKRRPGHGAPKLPAGSRMDVFDASGNLVRSAQAPTSFKGNLGLKPGEHAEFRGPDGKLVGELKDGGGKGKFQYYWGNANQSEWTKKWDENGGDGLLAWDVDGDGKITSGKELMGTVDLDGKNKFNNGYEKLAKYFDQDGNGVVEGAELAGLKIWEDRNGDGVTQDGELVDLASRGISSLSTSFDATDMSSTYRKR